MDIPGFGEGITVDEYDRYATTINLEELGLEGQERLKRGSVLIVGVGGVGCPAALYLAGIGVGRIGLADGDLIEVGNLHRQILYRTADVGRNKALTAAEALSEVNPEIAIESYPEFLDEERVAELAACYDMILDAADGLSTKLSIARACHRAGKPHCHVGIGAFSAQVMVCLPSRDSFSEVFGAEDALPRTKRGTFNATCGVAGSIAAAQVIKYLTGVGNLLTERVLCFDLRTDWFSSMGLK